MGDAWSATALSRHVDTIAHAVGRPRPRAACRAVAEYLELAGAWNRRLDLTAARTPAALAEVLALDALVLADPALVPVDARVLDVGTGGGAPLLPLMLLRPDLTGVGVEPRRKRVAFLRTAVGSLALHDRLRIEEARIEPDRAADGATEFDLAMSRATFSPERWVAMGRGLAPAVVAFTAAEPPPRAPAGMHEAHRESYRTPGAGAPRVITLYRRD